MNLEVEQVLEAFRPQVDGSNGSNIASLDTGNECRTEVFEAKNLVRGTRDIRAMGKGRSKGSTHGTLLKERTSATQRDRETIV